MKKKQQAPDAAVEGTKLEPIRFVTRELTRPDGTTLQVKVPVYPPFKLAEAKQGNQEKKAS
jgi:hypothetical protein